MLPGEQEAPRQGHWILDGPWDSPSWCRGVGAVTEGLPLCVWTLLMDLTLDISSPDRPQAQTQQQVREQLRLAPSWSAAVARLPLPRKD